MRRTAIAFSLLAPLLFASPAGAQDPTAGEIIEALKPKPLTRSWDRGVKVEGEREPDGPPSIDLHISFAFDSDQLDTDALMILDNLGRALADRQLSSYRFMIAGHTDAKGTDVYNQSLSQRRAASVKAYLIEKYAIAVPRLATTGYGESQLLDPSRPEDGINRRVQVINISEAPED